MRSNEIVFECKLCDEIVYVSTHDLDTFVKVDVNQDIAYSNEKGEQSTCLKGALEYIGVVLS